MTPEQERSPHAAPYPVLTVAAVARRLGVAPSTLRTWDRRYGLGPSAHTAGSHRRYGPDDLHRLSVMRGLTLEGVPPAEAAQIALGTPTGDVLAVDVLAADAGAFADDVLADGLRHDGLRHDGLRHDDPRHDDLRHDGLPADDVLADDGRRDVLRPVRPVVPRPGRTAGPEHLFDPGRPDLTVGGALHVDPALLHLDLPDLPDLTGLSELTDVDAVPPARAERPGGLFGFAGLAGMPLHPLADAVPEPGRGAAVWITDEPLPGAPRGIPSAEAVVRAVPDPLVGAQALLGPAGPAGSAAPGRAGGGRVLSLPDASPRARGLARAAMALDTFELQRLLRDAFAAYGVIGTWDSMVVPVLSGLGERWRTTGEAVDVEHAFSEAVMSSLRGVTLTLRRPRNAVPVLLSCPDGDNHSLPLHVMAAALAEEEVGCRMLGAAVPPAALLSAVRRTGPALVFVYARMPVQDASVLRELPRQRPAPRIVLGGPGWDGVALPATAARVVSLGEAVAAVLGADGR